MNISESAKLLALLAANYPHYYKNLSKTETSAVCKTWSDSFCDVPAPIVFEGIKQCIAYCKFPPTIAEVNEQITIMFFEASSLSNDMTKTQEIRSEAERLRSLLDSLGFDRRGKGKFPRRSSVMHLIELGGTDSLGLEA